MTPFYGAKKAPLLGHVHKSPYQAARAPDRATGVSVRPQYPPGPLLGHKHPLVPLISLEGDPCNLIREPYGPEGGTCGTTGGLRGPIGGIFDPTGGSHGQ